MFRNSRASVFSPSRRFRDTKSTFTQYPGPGTYQADDISVSDDKVRHFVLSNFKTNGVSRMVMPYKTINGDKVDQTDRSVKCRLDTPGPGQYVLPSDFGHLESFRGESPRRGNTQGSPRPKIIGRLQLSQMQGGGIDPPQLTGLDGTNRSAVKSMTM